MENKYLYIDDDNHENAVEKIDGFLSENLKIDTVQHSNSWEEQLKYIQNHSDDIDGLILDLKLDDCLNENKKRATFRGSTLAQEIRSRQKENLIKQMPIILFSANDKVKSSLEKAGIDIFDLFIDKGSVNVTTFNIYSKQLEALSESYKLIDQSKDIILNSILEIDIEELDIRFIETLNSLLQNPLHIILGFILNQLILKPGLLVNEDLLAARLGVDKYRSKDWNSLIEIISQTCKYNGVLSKGWERWWMCLVEKWWYENISTQHLRTVSAQDRVKLICDVTNLKDLVAAEKIEYAKSDEFWCVCKGLNKPLDPLDGLLIANQDHLYIWQDQEYVSVYAALMRINRGEWQNIAAVEQGKFETLKRIYSKP